MRRIFVTNEPFPTSPAVLAAAAAAGATEIVHGISPALAQDGITKAGYHEVPDPEPIPNRRAELLAVLDQSPLMLDELHEVLRTALTEGLI